MTWERVRRSRTLARPSPPISVWKSKKEPVFYRKSYEKASHGGQLEDVQDARGNQSLHREVRAAGGEVRTLRDRHLPAVYESRCGRLRRPELARPHRSAEPVLVQRGRLHRR